MLALTVSSLCQKTARPEGWALRPRDNTAAYLASWVKVLKGEKRAIITPLRRLRRVQTTSRPCSQAPKWKSPSLAFPICLLPDRRADLPVDDHGVGCLQAPTLMNADGSLFAGGGQ